MPLSFEISNIIKSQNSSKDRQVMDKTEMLRGEDPFKNLN